MKEKSLKQLRQELAPVRDDFVDRVVIAFMDSKNPKDLENRIKGIIYWYADEEKRIYAPALAKTINRGERKKTTKPKGVRKG